MIKAEVDIKKLIGKNVLLVCPNYPIPKKRKIHHDYLPIGLLKIGTYLRDNNGCNILFTFGNEKVDFNPDYIFITSLFTYWSDYVIHSAIFYDEEYPDSQIIIGGICASLMPEYIQEKTNVDVYLGLCKPAEEWCRKHNVDYSFLPSEVDFQIIHGMRGCFRKCGFCGTWKLEPEEEYVDNIPKLIQKNHVIFYDNNFLRHPDIKTILKELNEVRVEGKVVRFESQSGFDGRILNQELANLLKKSRFCNPRIAWDHSLMDAPQIKNQIQLLINAGYKRNEINIFMIYNWEHDFNEMEKKRIKCWQWGVQIMDCRYRPLNQTYDNFNLRLNQSSKDYYINNNWTDGEIKQFRRNVRRHNICVRHGFPFHSPSLEHKRIPKEDYQKIFKLKSRAEVRTMVPDAWFPGNFSKPKSQE